MERNSLGSTSLETSTPKNIQISGSKLQRRAQHTRSILTHETLTLITRRDRETYSYTYRTLTGTYKPSIQGLTASLRLALTRRSRKGSSYANTKSTDPSAPSAVSVCREVARYASRNIRGKRKKEEKQNREVKMVVIDEYRECAVCKHRKHEDYEESPCSSCEQPRPTNWEEEQRRRLKWI